MAEDPQVDTVEDLQVDTAEDHQADDHQADIVGDLQADRAEDPLKDTVDPQAKTPEDPKVGMAASHPDLADQTICLLAAQSGIHTDTTRQRLTDVSVSTQAERVG